ncbi:DUF2384 domain-containing protein [Sphingomonas sediminicola]|uniref:DUF2384 domain-containing protein n=1 Tax=Sphingomonas sediminicola TaxID=386874 RepID=A0ABX6T9D3_9SPHN|nr:DUF2384 domain-containing protein [Sphingomonas sediminicola]
MTTPQAFNTAADALGLSADVRARLVDLERQSHLVRLARALMGILPASRAACWLRASNKAFDGRTGLDMLLSSNPEEAQTVCQHAEYWAYNGW